MFLGIDLGTTNVKAILTGDDGQVLAGGSSPVSVTHVAGGGVEQDIEQIFQATVSAVRQLGATADLSKVRAVGLSSQGGAMQPLDTQGLPVGPVLSWMDQRGRDSELWHAVQGRGAAWLVSHTGHDLPGVGVAHMAHLHSINSRPPRLGFVGDQICRRLCGLAAHDATSLSIWGAFSPSLKQPDAEMLAMLGLRADQLPALLSPRETAGALLPEAAAALGLPPGVPVSAAIHDQYAATLGSGACRDGDVQFGTGTAWVLLAACGQLPSAPPSGVYLCTHVADGLFGLLMSMGNGGSAVQWASRTLRLEQSIDDALESAPAGADGLRCLPTLAYRGIGMRDTGGWLRGLKLGHTPAHVLRAVVEGLAMELRRHLDMLSIAGSRPMRLVMTGAAAASRVTPQIIADATGLPIACAAQSETSALGAAVIARGLVEPRTPLAELSAAMVRPARDLHPGPNANTYRELYQAYVSELPRE